MLTPEKIIKNTAKTDKYLDKFSGKLPHEFSWENYVVVISEVNKGVSGELIISLRWWKDAEEQYFNGPLIFPNPRLLVEDPNGSLILYSVNSQTGEETPRPYREDPIAVLEEVIRGMLK
jgi:hypothetical protein